ncbi:MAG: ATP phosphoribosyltransferase regulatory subunit [Proteobacteria bacterium]|nr:ATP phosphoribosyltransferase regulatory subunit [Pseudomonadota bacterium]
MKNNNWRLPPGVEELLPPRARILELVRREVLDIFNRWGFDYVEPPLIEYTDALLLETGSDLDLQTLKVIDQQSGRMMGVRADMTSQAVRIDAHSLVPEKGDDAHRVQRLCYAGSVVHAKPMGVLESRVPFRAGAEIFGVAGLEADAEVIALMIEVLAAMGIQSPVLVLGHMGIYQALAAGLALDATTERALFAAVQNKSETDIRQLLPASDLTDMLIALPAMMGRDDALKRARQQFASAPSGVVQALDVLPDLASRIRARAPQVEVRFDLAELAGYGYHNGPVFAAFHADQGRSVARGGRYDGIGKVFGRARPATGFDVNLTQLQYRNGQPVLSIWAPNVVANRDQLLDAVAQCRAAGERVIVGLTNDEKAPGECNRKLVWIDGSWQLQAIEETST